MQSLEELKKAREQMASAEAEILADIQAKATLLGYTLVKADNSTPNLPHSTDVPKRKRRTKEEMQAARAQEPTTAEVA